MTKLCTYLILVLLNFRKSDKKLLSQNIKLFRLIKKPKIKLQTTIFYFHNYFQV